jgi:hypothetical protein
MNYTVQEDGSLLFEAPISFVSDSYAPDPQNPCRYVPKFEPCRFRRLELKVLRCGKKAVDWRCTRFNEGINVTICRQCQVPSDEKQGRVDTSEQSGQ